MKLINSIRLLAAFFILCLPACQQTPLSASTGATTAPVTTIYVVRHAEKITADPADKDPDLNAEGMARAEALRTLLKDKPVDALYTTRYKRTIATLKPLSEERQLEVTTYEPSAYESLKRQVLLQHTGKTVVIAGHSNTILDIVEVFGVEKPFAEIPESKYDHIFKIMIAADNTATLETGQYGEFTN